MTKASLSLFCGLLLGLAAQTAHADIADTPANRAAQADRYLQAMPTKEMIADTLKALSANMPAGPQGEQMMKTISNSIDIPALVAAQKDSMVKHMTAEEIKALADFYSSPIGKSAMSKMPQVNADLMPVVQSQIMKSMSGAAGQ